MKKNALKTLCFNFSASYSGGGLKRLQAYLEWFNQQGGAWFIIHPSCQALTLKFPNNQYHIARQTKIGRLFQDCQYLSELNFRPYLYYAYGIPIVKPFGEKNWFHLSNVLPICRKGISLSVFQNIKQAYLGKQISLYCKNADIISAESQFSLNQMSLSHPAKLVVSVNGSDDEINTPYNSIKDNIAVSVGAFSYKALDDTYAVYEMLQQQHQDLQLMMIGDEKNIPGRIRKKKVNLLGTLPRSEVIQALNRARYYISTTTIENSYNAASEGIFFAEESYISDIGPHQELVANMKHQKIFMPKLSRPLLHLKREEIEPGGLKTWEEVILGMLEVVGL